MGRSTHAFHFLDVRLHYRDSTGLPFTLKTHSIFYVRNFGKHGKSKKILPWSLRPDLKFYISGPINIVGCGISHIAICTSLGLCQLRYGRGPENIYIIFDKLSRSAILSHTLYLRLGLRRYAICDGGTGPDNVYNAVSNVVGCGG